VPQNSGTRLLTNAEGIGLRESANLTLPAAAPRVPPSTRAAECLPLPLPMGRGPGWGAFAGRWRRPRSPVWSGPKFP